jgi:hypothetical protein
VDIIGASTSAVVVVVVLTADAVVCIVTVAAQALPRHQHQDHDVPLSRSFPPRHHNSPRRRSREEAAVDVMGSMRVYCEEGSGIIDKIQDRRN